MKTKYLDIIKNSDVLKRRGAGKRTLVEFIKYREYLSKNYQL